MKCVYKRFTVVVVTCRVFTHGILIIVIVSRDVEISCPLLLRTIKNEHIFRGYFSCRDAPPMSSLNMLECKTRIYTYYVAIQILRRFSLGNLQSNLKRGDID